MMLPRKDKKTLLFNLVVEAIVNVIQQGMMESLLISIIEVLALLYGLVDTLIRRMVGSQAMNNDGKNALIAQCK